MFGRIFNSWHIRPDIYQESHTDRANEPLRWGWVFFERAQILSGIQFTRHFIESVVVETKPFASSNVNVILTWQTCGQRSSMSAGSKRRALAFYFCVQICYMFPILKCRRESDLGLCTTSVLVNGMPPRICKFRQILRPNTSFNRMSPPCSGIHFCRHVYVCICATYLCMYMCRAFDIFGQTSHGAALDQRNCNYQGFRCSFSPLNYAEHKKFVIGIKTLEQSWLFIHDFLRP